MFGKGLKKMIELTESEEALIIKVREAKLEEEFYYTPKKIGYLKADLYEAVTSFSVCGSKYIFEEEKDDYIKNNLQFRLIIKKGTKFVAFRSGHYSKSHIWKSINSVIGGGDDWAEKHLENISEA